MKDIFKFDNRTQVDISENGDTPHFNGQHIIAVTVKDESKDLIRIAHYNRPYGSSGCGIPHPVGFYFPKSMVREVAESLLELASE